MTLRHTPLPEETFAPFVAKMREAGLPELSIRAFRHYYAQLVAGSTGFIPGAEAGPVEALPHYAGLDTSYDAAGRVALPKTIVLKLNGGLGTSMGMNGPKSLLPVKDGLTFLDIIVRQVLHFRSNTGVRLPLVLMNSFSTQDATLAALRAYPDLVQDLPFSFLQHKSPKVWVANLAPVTWPEDPEKEWCPPGHGDIYIALLTTGLLDQMLAAGYEYLFVSNSDNLGAVLDSRILGFVALRHVPFLMEVAERTAADRKGGHLARRPDGQLILRELSQCPPEELNHFLDIHRYRYFNTNNLWIHLPSLQELLRTNDDMLDLPLIRNEKPVDPTIPRSPRVYQLETAMGSAIAGFTGAEALCVPRSRFVPVKRSSDLVLLWSDAYRLTTDAQLIAQVPVLPLVELEDAHFALIEDLRRRFPYGAPSLRQATRLSVRGDVIFGRDITVVGEATIIHDGPQPLHIPDGARLGDRA
jgi:UTP--glucose-1-phosphate uridylyltransferase